jgi:heme-degrading monooxygenase HmoA
MRASRSHLLSPFAEEEFMIARIWHGATTVARSDEYLYRMRNVALPNYRAVKGNIGAYVLRRIDGDWAHFLTLSLWASADAIAEFAGADIDRARYYEFDKDFLDELEATVKHYEIFDR